MPAKAIKGKTLLTQPAPAVCTELNSSPGWRTDKSWPITVGIEEKMLVVLCEVPIHSIVCVPCGVPACQFVLFVAFACKTVWTAVAPLKFPFRWTGWCSVFAAGNRTSSVQTLCKVPRALRSTPRSRTCRSSRALTEFWNLQGVFEVSESVKRSGNFAPLRTLSDVLKLLCVLTEHYRALTALSPTEWPRKVWSSKIVVLQTS